MTERPRLVEEANTLKSLHQSGNEKDCYEAALSCFYGISEIMVAAEDRKDDRLVTFSATQIAALAERVGWLDNDREQKARKERENL
jgi:hypothetical protein